MEFPAAPAPDADATCVPFAQATTAQRTLALAAARQELGGHFPTLDPPVWDRTLRALAPDLWVVGEQVQLDYADLTQLTQRLAAAPELPALDPPIYPNQAAYLAKRLLNYQDEAIHALADIEANPQAYGPNVLALVTGLAAGNGIAQQVYRATHPGPEHAPNRPDPARKRAGVAGRVAAIYHARGERAYDQPLPPPAEPAA